MPPEFLPLHDPEQDDRRRSIVRNGDDLDAAVAEEGGDDAVTITGGHGLVPSGVQKAHSGPAKIASSAGKLGSNS